MNVWMTHFPPNTPVIYTDAESHGTVLTCVCGHPVGARSFTFEDLCFPLWLSELFDRMNRRITKRSGFNMDSTVMSAVIASYLCAKRWSWLPSRWSPVLRVPTFLSSVSASLSASPPLVWLNPRTVDVYFILISSETKKCVKKVSRQSIDRV